MPPGYYGANTDVERSVPDLDTFLDDLSSPAPVPGGGSAAALSAAMGAALLAMVCNLTIGRKRYADVQAEVAGIRGRAMELRDRARRLAQEDEDAYGRVAEAMKLPRDTDAERERRTSAVQQSLKEAAAPPLETMRVASEILDLGRQLAGIGNRSAISDVGSAGYLAWAAFGSASLNVDINVNAVDDEEWVASTRASQADLQRAESVFRDVQRVVAGTLGAGA